MLNNIEEDIKIVEQCIVGSISVPLNLDNIDLNNYRDAISNVLNNCKKNQKIVDQIRCKINERQFELQQEYKYFKDDIRLNTLQEIYYMFKEE